ncbi:hypothetical protein ACX80R_11540 [Paeniglutamicibacter antarcticus]
MSMARKNASIGKAAIFFAVLTALAFISGSIAPLWRIFGFALALITVVLALRWWISIRTVRHR